MNTNNLLKRICKFINTYLIYWFIYRFTKSCLSVKQFNNILIIAPHPDDEILGLGGVILQTLQNGGKVHLVYLTDGEASGVWPDHKEIKRQRILLSIEVCNLLGIQPQDIIRLHIPDGGVPHQGQTGFGEAVLNVKELIEKIKPESVLATHKLDYWPYDHVVCGNIVHEAVKQSIHKPQLWYYWVWAWYNLRPLQLFQLNYTKMFRVDIRKQLAKKQKLTDLYLNALTPDGKPWSGVLPKELIKALEQPFEIIEKIEIDI